MAVWIAEKTLAQINETIVADGGNSFRHWQGRTLPHIGDAYRDDDDNGPRKHLGASVIGQACERAIYYGHRWAPKRAPSGYKGEDSIAAHARIQRLWNRGHLEEGRFIALLLMIGAQVYQQDANGDQFRISYFGGHFGGSGDGFAVGIPDLPPGVPCGIEAKTHGEKSFEKLKADGVEIAKPEHFAQMQIYMGGFGMLYCLYMAVNKNNDELHFEIVSYRGEVDEYFRRRAERLIFTHTVPDRLRGASPGYFRCKFCDFADVCFGAVKVARNCRTCAHVEALPDGTWVCMHRDNLGVVLSTEAQRIGCESWREGSF
jgi:hypothetical protein